MWTPDVNDVLLNTLSTLAGVWAFIVAHRMLGAHAREGRGEAPEPDAAR
jgi:hypothetical protein